MAAVKVEQLFRDRLISVGKEAHEVKKIEAYLTECKSSGETLLHWGAKHGEIEIVKLMIECGLDVDAQDNKGQTPIMLAIETRPREYTKIIEILCDANADIHKPNNFGVSAAQLVLGEKNVNDVVSTLFLNIIHRECFYNSEVTAKKLFNLKCPLWKAVLLQKSAVIEHMVDLGSNVNSQDCDKSYSALNKAIKLMNLEIVKVLVAKSADVDLISSKGKLPIAEYGFYSPGTIQKPEIIKILLEKSVALRDLHQRRIVSQFQQVFECGNKEVIEMLLEYHEDILNVRDSRNQTPLHYLFGNYHEDITEVLQGRDIDLNVIDVGNRTPIYMATNYLYCHINTFKYLLENGADINVKTAVEGVDVALFSLCLNPSISKELYYSIIKLFLEYNLDIQVVGDNDTTVFDIIKQKESFYQSEPLLAHLAILVEQGNFLTEYIRYKINSHKIFKSYFIDCRTELTKMKNHFINYKLTVYNILTDDFREEQILKSCRTNPKAILQFEKLKKMFHPIKYYSDIVKKRISSIVLGLELQKKAALIICKFFNLNDNPYHIVVSEIIDYLNTQDLETLTQVEV